MKLLRILLCAVALSAPALPAWAKESSSAASLYNEGNGSYRDGDFGRSVEFYEKALAQGAHDARLDYNLACAYAKVGDVGRARLHFERARLLDSSDEDARRNLEILRTRIPGEPERLSAGILEGVVAWYESLGFDSLLAPAQVFWWGLWLCAIAEVLWRGERRGEWARMGRFAAIVFLAGTLAIAYAKHRQLSVPRAVVLRDGASVRSGPTDEEAEVVRLAAGRLVERGRSRGTWVEVSLPGEFEGWLPDAAVSDLSPPVQ